MTFREALELWRNGDARLASHIGRLLERGIELESATYRPAPSGLYLVPGGRHDDNG